MQFADIDWSLGLSVRFYLLQGATSTICNLSSLQAKWPIRVRSCPFARQAALQRADYPRVTTRCGWEVFLLSTKVDTLAECYWFRKSSTGEQRSFGFPAAKPKFTRCPTCGLTPAPKKSLE